jgi:hypothetical protein
LFLSNSPHYRANQGHLGRRAAAGGQLLLQVADGGIFSAAIRAALEVRLAVAELLGFEQSFPAGDQVFPAFSAVHR